jgi:serine O-acetyltransferase
MFDFVRGDLQELAFQEGRTKVFHPGLFVHLGFHAVLLYRLSRWFHLHHVNAIAVLISYINSVLTGTQISPRATIGKGLVIYHPHGMVVGATAVIGENCVLTHGNMVGQRYGGGDRPTIGNNFYAGTGAKMLGAIQIGDNVRVAANSVVLSSLPDYATAAGIPATVVKIRQPRSTSRTDVKQIRSTG